MKKLLLSLFFAITLLHVVIAEEGHDPAIPVVFTYQTGLNAGFSKEYVESITWKTSEFSTSSPVEFKYDSATGNIETGPFHFYLQIYSAEKIRVSLSSGQNKLTGTNGETLTYLNHGFDISTSRTLYDESNSETAKKVNTSYPRVFDQYLSLYIDPDMLLNLNSTEFRGTLSFTVETVS